MAVAELKTHRINFKYKHKRVKKQHRDILVKGTANTRRLEGLERIVGQEVALRKTLQVMDWDSPNANIHFIGGPGVGKSYLAAAVISQEAEYVAKNNFDPSSVRHPDPKVRKAFARIIKKKDTNKPPEQVVLYNFDIPEHPITVPLYEPGLVDTFARDMRTFVEAYSERMEEDCLDLGRGFDKWVTACEGEFRKNVERRFKVDDGAYIQYDLRYSLDRPGLFSARLNLRRNGATEKTKKKVGKVAWNKNRRQWSREFDEKVFKPAYDTYKRKTSSIGEYISFLTKTKDLDHKGFADIVESYLDEINDLRHKYGMKPYTMEDLSEKIELFELFPNSAENIARLHGHIIGEKWQGHPDLEACIERFTEELTIPRIYREFEDEELDAVEGDVGERLRPRRGVEIKTNGNGSKVTSHVSIQDKPLIIREVNSVGKENFFGQIEFDSTGDKPAHQKVSIGLAAQSHYVLVDEGKGLLSSDDFLNEILTYMEKGEYQIQGGEGGRNVGRGNILTKVKGTARLWVCSNDDIFKKHEPARQRFQTIPFRNYIDFNPESIQHAADLFETSMHEYMTRENGDEVKLPKLTRTGMQKIGQLLAASKYKRGKISVSFRDPLNFAFLTAVGKRVYNQSTEITGDDVVAAVRQSISELEIISLSSEDFANDQYKRDDFQVGRVYGVGVGNSSMGWPGFGVGSIGGIEAIVRIGNETSGQMFSSYSEVGKTGEEAQLAELVNFQALGKHNSHIGFNIDMHNEWNYSDFDGPSSGIAQQVAIMSAITGVRLSQNVVITGAVKDITRNDASTIGGVAFKAYGAYEDLKKYCERHNLEFSKQGYKFIMPEMNHDEYALWEDFLPQDFIDAVSSGEFDLYTVSNVNQAFMISAHQGDLKDAVGKRKKVTESSIDELMEQSICSWNEEHMDIRRQHHYVAE